MHPMHQMGVKSMLSLEFAGCKWDAPTHPGGKIMLQVRNGERKYTKKPPTRGRGQGTRERVPFGGGNYSRVEAIWSTSQDPFVKAR